MGTEVQSKSYLPGYCSSMRELDEDGSSGSWHLNRGNTFVGGQYYDGHFQGTSIDSRSEYDRDLLKQKMIEHDTVFRRQVCELHRLYRTQRDLMDEVKRSQLYNHQKQFSSNPLGFQRQDSGKWPGSVFPSPNSTGTSPSVLGTEHSSPNMSFLKGKTPQNDFPSAGNVDDSKDCEIIECRPGKVRRKMFDLQLSADGYIDPDEFNHYGDGKTRISSGCVPSSSSNGQSYLGLNRHLGSALTNSKVNPLGRSCNGMRDLNEPIQFEDDDTPVQDFMSQMTSQRDAGHVKAHAMPSQSRSFLKESAFSSQYGGDYGGPRRPQMVNKENGAQAPHTFAIGQINTQDSYMSHHLQSDSSRGRHHMSHGTLSIPPDQKKEIFWKDGMMLGPNLSEHSHRFVTVPQVHSSNHYVRSGELVNSWPYPVTAWEKFGYSSSQSANEKQSCFNSSVALSKSSQASSKPSRIFGQQLIVNSSPAVNKRKYNEVDPGSSSGSKEESISYPSQTSGAIASVHPGYGMSSQHSKGMNCIDLNSSKDLDLNVSVTDNIHQESAPLHDLTTAEKRIEQGQATSLPWLKPKPVGGDTKNMNFGQASSSKFLHKNESSKITSSCLTHAAGSVSISSTRDFDLTNSSTDRISNGKMILGFPIFAKPKAADTDFSCGTLSCIQASMVEGTDNKRKVQAFDMNLPCEAEVTIEIMAAEKHADNEVPDLKNLLDLNASLDEDETFTTSSSQVSKDLRGIDLEAPPPLEIEEGNILLERHNVSVFQQKQQKEELVNAAAEAIVSISSLKESCILEGAVCNSPHTPLETLKWFVDVVSSCEGAEQSANGVPQPNEMALNKDEPVNITTSDETDSFEQMTLNLTEMSAEEYMPKNPFLPMPNIDEEPCALAATRPRRGQARRGRPKRDFQRDILPGLSSLSRHEVTEDLQAFGGLMRASGHPWQLGRANKPRRGRPRTVNIIPVVEPLTPVCSPPKQQTTNCIEVGVDDRSFTGWGKTTRRPRRQRCPPGTNLQAIRLG